MTNKTPGAEWMVKQEPDPFNGRYDVTRNELPMGDMTDYHFANQLYLCGDQSPSLEQLLSGEAKRPIVWLTAAKERIRWLSYQLHLAESSQVKPDMRRYISKAELRAFIKEQTDRSIGKVALMGALKELAKEKGNQVNDRFY